MVVRYIVCPTTASFLSKFWSCAISADIRAMYMIRCEHIPSPEWDRRWTWSSAGAEGSQVLKGVPISSGTGE